MRRYHTQQYVNGTKCDLNGNLRRTEVRVSDLKLIGISLYYITCVVSNNNTFLR